ncbi:MAG: kinase [Lachnospiraceae bacterium]|nr:kinase [Lachnospiraceae bacterium]MCI9133600.1 kinase [Lachnospiraceae bacterium]
MAETERLQKVLAFIREKGWSHTCHEEDGCGSIDFEYRGVPYHIWEFEDGERGVETNVRHGGKQEEILGDYEAILLEIMGEW